MRWRDVAAAAALSATVHAPALATATPLQADEAYISIMATMLRVGRVLYVEAIDRKPPLVVWLYEGLLTADWGLWWVRFVMVLGVALNGLTVAAIARRMGLSHERARLAGALAIVGTALFGPGDAHGADFELFGLWPASLAVLAALIARDRIEGDERSRSWLGAAALAGLCGAVAANCKQPFIFTMLPVAVALPSSRRVSGSLIAAVAFVLAMSAVAAASGWSPYWRWVWFDNGDYLDVPLARVSWLAVRQTAIFAAVQWSLVIPACFAWQGARLSRDRAWLMAWIAAALLGVASGARFFGHYYQQLVPVLAILAAVGLSESRLRRWVPEAVAWAMALWTLFAIPSWYTRPMAPPELVEVLRTRTTAADTVLVWGRLPAASVEARRILAGPFAHQGYLTGRWTYSASFPETTDSPFNERWREFIRQLEARPPAVIVDATTPADGWDRYAVALTPLGDFVARCYQRLPGVAGMPVWHRDERPCK